MRDKVSLLSPHGAHLRFLLFLWTPNRRRVVRIRVLSNDFCVFFFFFFYIKFVRTLEVIEKKTIRYTFCFFFSPTGINLYGFIHGACLPIVSKDSRVWNVTGVDNYSYQNTWSWFSSFFLLLKRVQGRMKKTTSNKEIRSSFVGSFLSFFFFFFPPKRVCKSPSFPFFFNEPRVRPVWIALPKNRHEFITKR